MKASILLLAACGVLHTFQLRAASTPQTISPASPRIICPVKGMPNTRATLNPVSGKYEPLELDRHTGIWKVAAPDFDTYKVILKARKADVLRTAGVETDAAVSQPVRPLGCHALRTSAASAVPVANRTSSMGARPFCPLKGGASCGGMTPPSCVPKICRQVLPCPARSSACGRAVDNRGGISGQNVLVRGGSCMTPSRTVMARGSGR